MRLTLLVKIILIIFGCVGSFLSALFFYFLNSLNSKLRLMQKNIDKLLRNILRLRLKYFLDAAGFSKIFVFKTDAENSLNKLDKRILRILDAYDKMKNQ